MKLSVVHFVRCTAYKNSTLERISTRVVNILQTYLTYFQSSLLKFIYSEKATKFCKIFILLLSYVVPVKREGEDFAKFCGLLRIYELYEVKKNNFAKFFSLRHVRSPFLTSQRRVSTLVSRAPSHQQVLKNSSSTPTDSEFGNLDYLGSLELSPNSSSEQPIFQKYSHSIKDLEKRKKYRAASDISQLCHLKHYSIFIKLFGQKIAS